MSAEAGERDNVPITMEQIAKKLRISITTVSRALSSRPESVSEETRKAIYKLAEELGYKRKPAVRKSVAFVIDKESFKISSQFWERVISGVEGELVSNHYYFQFNSSERKNFDLKRINLNFSDLAGIILVGFYHDDFILQLREMGIPMVLVEHYIPTEDINAVMIDNADGILKACKYLVSLGHKRVAYISGDKMEMSTHERFLGYQRAKQMFGLVDDPGLVAEDCLSRIDEGFKAMSAILERGKNPTAVVAYNDIIAIGAMEAIKQKGLRIPQDINVVGFDDINMAAEVLPALTTVHVPKGVLGSKAVERLLEIINGKGDLITKVLVPTHLVVRQSTGNPSSQA